VERDATPTALTGSEGSPGALLAGRYAFEAELSPGGSGRVMRVRDIALGEVCVAKAVDPANAARLAAELDALREVRHPGVVQPRELLRLTQALGPPFVLPAGTAVLVSSWVPGQTLAAHGPCASWQDLAALGAALAGALSELHRANVVHGDVSPNNVMMTPEGPVWIDLGHAGAPRLTGPGASGTLGFMAPEAFAGARTPGTDLFALAATLLSVAPSGPRDAASELTLAEAHERALGVRHTLAERLLGAPVPLAELLGAMLAPDAAARLDDADEVARRLRWVSTPAAAEVDADARASGRAGKRSPERLASALRHAPFVGHGEALERVVNAVRARSAAGLPATLVEVAGPPGSGRERFAHELAQRLQRLAFDAGWVVPTVTRSQALPPPPAHPAILLGHHGLDSARALRFLDATEVQRAPCVVVMSGSPSSEDAATDHDHVGDPRHVRATLRPVDAPTVRALLARVFGEDPSDAEVDAALQLSGGLVGTLCAVLATHALDGSLTRPRDLPRLSSRSRASHGALPKLPTATLELLERAALCRDGLPLDGDAPEGLSAALTLGLLSTSSAGLLVPRADVREALLAGLTRARRVSIANALLGNVDDALVHAHLALEADDPRRAEEELTTALRRAPAHSPSGATPERVFELAARLPAPSPATRCATAEWLRRAGEPTLALSLLGGARDSAAALLRAEILRQRGDVTGAQQALATVANVELDAGMNEVFLRTAGRLALELERRAGGTARVVSTRGTGQLNVAEQVSVAELLGAFRAAQPETFDESPAYHEVRATSAWQAGDAERCDTDAETASALYLRRGLPGEAARASALRALVAQRRGDAAAAYAHGRRAFELAEGAGERLAAAVYGLNLGLACFEQGRLGEALTRVRSGAEQIAELGNDALLAHATLNLAHIHQAFGDDTAAAELLPLAERSALRAGQSNVATHADLTWAGIELRRGKRQASLARLDSALERISACGEEARPLLLARAALGLAEAGLVARAHEVLSAHELAEASQQADTTRVVQLARGTLALTGTSGERREAADALATRPQDGHGWERTLDAALLQGELLDRLGDGPASVSALRRARSMLDLALDSLPNALRPLLLSTSRYHAALRVAPLDDGATPSGGRAGDVFRELPTWMQRFIQAGPPTRLMQRIADAAQALTRAERGFLVEREPTGSWLTLASTEEAPGPALAFSRSVASRALATGRVVSALDAVEDAQLATSGSVLGIGTRSVLAAPLRCPGRELVLYVDDRLRPAAFDPLSEDVFAACAQLAGLALRASLDAAELHANQQALATAEAALRAHVDTQREEITSLRRAVASADRGGIIAGPGPMRQALELAERAAASAVPVLLLGESGTGKELVARHLHEHSERRGQRFISENCAAIPDTLLESALFGHERGAFTGADRARQGLFHAADGGTLFLDEIGEMSAAMQSKLLRVLQNGEVRAVGGSRVSHVNVRLVTATHRDLRAMVAAGTFREDLYYRVTVVTLELPPLRERRSDIPLLVRHFVSKHQPGQARRITPEAMQRLVTAPWPGNVRQLENEVQRLLVMAGDPVDVRDVAAMVAVTAAPGADADAPLAGSLALRDHVDALERRLITEAMARTDSNQTRAALTLGISRYGLQKMMKRLGLRG
jgi:serine/threonine-protein kinase PknK